MKRWLVVLLLVGLLSGCGSVNGHMDQALKLRNTLLGGNECTFDAVITADYGDKIYNFTMKNTVDANGNLTFEVISPDSISGITGRIQDEKGALTFDREVLAFSLMADGQITPVSAPWIFIKTLRSGYISACENLDSGIHLQIDDSYDEDALQLDIWTDANNMPIRSEIFYKGRRIITLDVDNFTIV